MDLSPHTLLALLAAALTLEFGVGQILAQLNQEYPPPVLPHHLGHLYSPDKYARALEYKKEGHRVSTFGAWAGYLVVMGLLLSGGFSGLHHLITGLEPTSRWHSMLFFGLLYVGSDLLAIPVQLYATFVVEARYGFNTTTPRTFLVDKLKSYALVLLLGGPLLYGLLTVIHHWGAGFWWRAWILVMAISLIMGYVYTSFLLPIFNKLSPLPDGTLLQAIGQLSQRLHFPLKRVMLMDASKRSTKANAFFSGFGKLKTIVLTDNLLRDHTNDEVLAVLAHEIGHYKLRHTWVQMGISAITTGATLYVLSLVLFSLGMSRAMGASVWVLHLNLLAAGLLFSPINLIIGLFTNALSRRHEFMADAYAANHVPAQHLALALGNLARNSLDDLFPHPAYVRAYYSHPTIPQRMAALEGRGGEVREG